MVCDSIESEVKKGIIKARILTGVYMLQVNRHLFSGRSIEPTCQLCWLEEEDIYHLATRCPAYQEDRVATVQRLKLLVVEQSSSEIWSTYFKDWFYPESVNLSRLCQSHCARTVHLTDQYRGSFIKYIKKEGADLNNGNNGCLHPPQEMYIYI